MFAPYPHPSMAAHSSSKCPCGAPLGEAPLADYVGSLAHGSRDTGLLSGHGWARAIPIL